MNFRLNYCFTLVNVISNRGLGMFQMDQNSTDILLTIQYKYLRNYVNKIVT